MATAVFGGSNRHARSGGGSASGESGELDSSPASIGTDASQPGFDSADSADVADADNASGIIDPASIGTVTADTDAPYGRFKSGKPRKRPRNGSDRNSGGDRRDTRAKPSKASGDLTALLHSIHMMGASFLGIPQLVLDEDEAKRMGEAVARVTELYDVPMMSEEARAWTNLALVSGAIYGPRFISYSLDKKTKPKSTGPALVN